MNPRVKSVRTNPDYTLTIVFDSGETRRFDVKPYLEKGVFKELRALNNFNSMNFQNGTMASAGRFQFPKCRIIIGLKGSSSFPVQMGS